MQKEASAKDSNRTRYFSRHPDAIPIAALFIASMGFHLATAATTITFSDSGDFLMSLATVGNGHGPGYPLYLTTCKAFTLLFPFGSLAFRASVYSSIFASLAICLVYWIVFRLTRSRAGAVVAALVFCFSYTFWYETVIPETYALDAFMIALLIVLALRWERQLKEKQTGPATNTLCLFALVYGLEMANHITALFFLPAFAFFALDTDWRQVLAPRNLIRVAAFFALGLLPYLYMPTAAFRGPAYNYGDPSTLTRWLQMVTVHYQRGGLFQYPVKLLPARFFRYFGTLTTEFPYFAWLGGLGLVASFFKKQKRAVFLVLLFLFSLIPVMTYDQLESVLRAHFYYPSYLFFSIWIGFGAALLIRGVARVLEHRDRVVQVTAVSLVVLLLSASPVLALVIHYAKVDKNGYNYARQLALKILLPVEKDGIVFTDSDNIFFPPQYMQVVEHVRPDVRVINVTSIGAPGFHGLDLLSSATTEGPSEAGPSRFIQVVENSFATTPVYSANPTIISPKWSSTWLGYLIRFKPPGIAATGVVTSPIRAEGNYADVDSDGREALLFPDALRALVKSAASDYTGASNDYNQAVTAFQKNMYVPTLYGCGDFSQFYQSWGSVLAKLGQDKRIVARLPRAEKINPDFYSLDLARAYIELNNVPAAVGELEGLLAFEPDNAEGLRLLGEAYYRQGRDADAVRVLEKSIEREPANPLAYYLDAESLSALGNKSKAIEQYRMVIKLDANGVLGQAAARKIQELQQPK